MTGLKIIGTNEIWNITHFQTNKLYTVNKYIMNTLKLGSSGGEDLDFLTELLEIGKKSEFDRDLDIIVKDYQEKNNLVVDGEVGYKTWKSLIIRYREKYRPGGDITDWDYEMFGKLLGVESACLKAVIKVETGSKGGFEKSGKPQILFEGHVFWRELVKLGKNPSQLVPGNEDILYKTWDKSKYRGGEKEWIRFEKAEKIDRSAAIKSASWGMFQIMGNNYALCGCRSVSEFFESMCKSKFSQFVLGMDFLKQSKLVKYLVMKDWTGFAKGYNGPSYAKNSYDKKLKSAFLTFYP